MKRHVRSHRFARRVLASWRGPVGRALPWWASCDLCGHPVAAHAYLT